MMTQSKIFSRAGFVVFALSSAALLTGCLDDDNNPAPQPVAYVNIYHASPDADDLDIIVNSNAINTEPFQYTDYTGYLPYYAGKRTLKFSEAGDLSEIVLDTAFQFANGKMYSVFIADSLSSIEAVILGDSAEIPDAGKAMIRVVHLSPDAPELNVLADDADLFSSLSFKEGSAFKEIESGTLTIEFQAVEGGNEVLLTVPGVELESKEYYTIVLKGFSTPPAGNENEIDTDVIKL